MIPMPQRVRSLFDKWLTRRIPPAPMVTLSHRQIFIVPTRAGLALLLLLLILLIGAINYQNSLVYGVTFLLGSLFWVSLHHTYRNLASLEVHAAGSIPVFAGEMAPLELNLLAPRHEHQALVFSWPDAQSRQIDLGRNGESRITLYHPTQKRGWLRPGRLRIETRYPLGWFVAWSLVDLDWQVLVYPRVISLPLPSFVQGGEGETEQQMVEGSDDFQGLRDYQPGDSRKRLDWRAYSRGQGLHSKVFAEPLSNTYWLDLASTPGVDLEQRLSHIAGWIMQLELADQSYGLQVGEIRIATDRGERHRDRCLRTLALFGSAQ